MMLEFLGGFLQLSLCYISLGLCQILRLANTDERFLVELTGTGVGFHIYLNISCSTPLQLLQCIILKLLFSYSQYNSQVLF